MTTVRVKSDSITTINHLESANAQNFHRYVPLRSCTALLVSNAKAETSHQSSLRYEEVDSYIEPVADQLDQVTSVDQFNDVEPTDWAYQAIKNLAETYGCVAGYPDQSLRGDRSITRYEAAALLNSCLDSVTEITDEIKKLIYLLKQSLH